METILVQPKGWCSRTGFSLALFLGLGVLVLLAVCDWGRPRRYLRRSHPDREVRAVPGDRAIEILEPVVQEAEIHRAIDPSQQVSWESGTPDESSRTATPSVDVDP